MSSKNKQPNVKGQAKDLHAQLADLRRDMSEARRSLAANELPNPRVIRTARKEIARTLTRINAKKAHKEKADV